MILILTATAAVFVSGVVIGVLAMIVIGIHAEQHRSARVDGRANTVTGAASRRLGLLNVRVADTRDGDEQAQVRR
jgi:hypothetical protein